MRVEFKLIVAHCMHRLRPQPHRHRRRIDRAGQVSAIVSGVAARPGEALGVDGDAASLTRGERDSCGDARRGSRIVPRVVRSGNVSVHQMDGPADSKRHQPSARKNERRPSHLVQQTFRRRGGVEMGRGLLQFRADPRGGHANDYGHHAACQDHDREATRTHGPCPANRRKSAKSPSQALLISGVHSAPAASRRISTTTSKNRENTSGGTSYPAWVITSLRIMPSA